MLPWQPEMEKKSRDTLMDRFKQHFNGFFLHVVHARFVESCSGVAVGIRLEGVGIDDAFVEDDFVSFGFFDGF